MGTEPLIPHGFKIPKSKSDKIVSYAKERDVKISVILNEAVTEYINRREHPERQIEMIQHVLLTHPELLDEPLRRYNAWNLSGRTSNQ